MPAPGAIAHDRVDAAMHLIATAIEVVGVAVIVVRALLASARLLCRGIGLNSWDEAYECFRADLGRSILLGLGFLAGPSPLVPRRFAKLHEPPEPQGGTA